MNDRPTTVIDGETVCDCECVCHPGLSRPMCFSELDEQGACPECNEAGC